MRCSNSGALERRSRRATRYPGERIRARRRAQYPRRRPRQARPAWRGVGKLRRARFAVAPRRASTFRSIAARACLSSNRIDEALPSFDKALASDPENVVALINRGKACIKDKRFAEALAKLRQRAGASIPIKPVALTDRGIALAEMGRFEEALACPRSGASYRAACRRRPRQSRQRADQACAACEEALASYERGAARWIPISAEANFNAAITRLCLGDFRDGWKQYEYRWKKKTIRGAAA